MPAKPPNAVSGNGSRPPKTKPQASRKGGGPAATLVAENGNGYDDYTGLLIDRLASAIVDDSLPLKDVERELRGCVAEVAVHKRGLDKRETANRCGVTEKSIENYLKEARSNPKSPEREVARVLQDDMLSLEEIHERVYPVVAQARNFTLDDAKRCLEKLIRTGEVSEYPGHRYRAVNRPSIRYPATAEVHRELVDQKARDLDYIVLKQKEATDEDVQARTQRYSRVVSDTNLVRIDFTVDAPREKLPEFYEKLSEQIAQLTMKYEKKKGASRIRVLIGMRSVTALVFSTLLLLAPVQSAVAQDAADLPAGSPTVSSLPEDSWELDRNGAAAGGGSEGGQDSKQNLHGIQRETSARDEEPGSPPPNGKSEGSEAEDEAADAERLVGDLNDDAEVTLTDVVLLLGYLYDGVDTDPPIELADADGNGVVDMADPLFLLEWLFGPTREQAPEAASTGPDDDQLSQDDDPVSEEGSG